VAVGDDWHGSRPGGHPDGYVDGHRAKPGTGHDGGIVLATNTRMLKFARQLGFRRERDPGERDVLRIVREL